MNMVIGFAIAASTLIVMSSCVLIARLLKMRRQYKEALTALQQLPPGGPYRSLAEEEVIGDTDVFSYLVSLTWRAVRPRGIPISYFESESRRFRVYRTAVSVMEGLADKQYDLSDKLISQASVRKLFDILAKRFPPDVAAEDREMFNKARYHEDRKEPPGTVRVEK